MSFMVADGLVLAVCQIASFGLVNDNYRVGRYPPFDRARPGCSFSMSFQALH